MTSRSPEGRAFADTFEQHGDAVALIDEAGDTLSYRQLAEAADAFAATLPAGRQLALLDIANRMDSVVAYAGLLRSHRPVILSDEASPGRAALIDTFDPAIVIDAAGEALIRQTNASPALHPDLAVLLSTSGTTGATKLVRLSAANIDANARSIAEYLELGPSDRAVTTLPFHYSYGLSVLHSHLVAGGSLLLTERSVIEPGFFETLERGGATSLAGVPYTYELLERVGFRERAPAALRTLTQAGGRMPVDLVRAYGEWTRASGRRFYVMYGQTEATARIAYLPPGRLAGNEGKIGIAIPRGELTLERDGAAVDSGEGELVYRGPNVMLGYAEAAADLARGAEVAALHTGDLAERDDGGLFRITGRSSRFSKLFGLRISHDQVEQVARELGATAAVTGDDERIALCIVGDADPDALRAALAERLGLPANTFAIERRAELPRLASGKTDYRAILEAARKASPAASGHKPLMALYRDAFPHADVHNGDSFISLGGDSLVYVTIAAEIEDRFGRLPRGWEERSIRELEGMAPGAKRSVIDSELLLRALAIVAIVINHASDRVVGGGTGALLLLCGYNWARFQRTRLARGEFWRSVGDFALRVVAPVYAVTLAVAVLHEWPGWPSLFLISNFVGQHRGILEPFWFIEALFQSTLVMALIGSFPAAQRAIAKRPAAFGWALLAASLAVGWVAAGLFSHVRLANRTPDVLFPLIALGWCAYFAEGKAKLAVMIAAVGIALWDLSHWASLGPVRFGMLHREVWPVGAALLIMFVPCVPMPAPLRRLVVTISVASFTIYIVHGLPIWVINRLGGEDLGLLKVASGILLGLAMQPVMGWAIASAGRLRGRRLPKSVATGHEGA